LRSFILTDVSISVFIFSQLSNMYCSPTICYCDDFPAAIAMMADGRIKADGYITKRIALDDIVKEGFNTLTGPDKKAQVKIIVTPDKSLL
jgi:(R,R)-butanediol dehydrogenase / meso-butanediol dehydrogenase / diacetyl reductase